MASFLAPLGTASYNGHVFNGSVGSRVRCRCVPDRANRTTTHVEYELTCRETIIPDGLSPGATAQTENAMLTLRNQLSVRGQRLQFTAQGFGAFDINNGTVLDISYGPHPEVLEMVNLGGGNAYSLLWRCTTRIPQCGGAVYQGKPLASNYDIEFRRDKHGRTVRTVTGYIEIPANRSGSAITDTADGYWESIINAVPMIYGFEREFTRKLSMDKRTMDYTITDTQKPPTGFQDRCTDWEGEQDTDIREGGATGVVTISASFEVEDTQPKVVALSRFFDLVASRVLAGAPFGSLASFYPLVWHVRDQLHGRRVSCTLSYEITSDAHTILAASGIFAPIPNSDWTTWQGGIPDALGPRGTANLIYDKSSDAIIDLCTASSTGMRTSGGGGQDHELRSNLFFLGTLPPPNQSYLHYEMRTRLLGEANLIFSKPMSADLQTSDYQQNQLQAGDPFNVDPPGNRFGSVNIESSGSQVPDLAQATVAADWYIVLSGYAMRVGYPVPLPNIQAVGSIQAYLVNVDAENGIAMNAGVPAHWSRFVLTYRLPQKPLASAPLYNPVLQTTEAQ